MAHGEAPAGRGWRTWTRGERLVVVAGVLLVADLIVLPWHHYGLNLDTGDLGDLGIDLPDFSFNRTGVQSPNPGFGLAATFVAAAMVGQIVAVKLGSAMPKLPQLHLIAGPAVLGLLLAKVVTNDEYLGTGAWLGILLAAALALGGYMLSQEPSASPASGPTRRQGPPTGSEPWP